MSRGGDGSDAYGMDEVAVSLTITDGKLTVESKSGPKSGSLELSVGDSTAVLALDGSGSDRASVELTGPELANFRTMIDAALSALTEGEPSSDLARNVLFSGYRPLEQRDKGYGIAFEEETLRRLDLVTDDGQIAGGSRQVQCTVLGNGTAIVNLRGDRMDGTDP